MDHMRQRFVANLLFPAPSATYTIDSFPSELIWAPKGPIVDVESGTGPEGDDLSDHAPCLLLPCESARYLIIFFHSNAEDLGGCRWFCNFLRDQFQVHVLAVEYPGYGVCPGRTSCESIMDNANAAMQFATQALKLPLDRIKLFGRSIGTGPCLALAAKFRVAGVILVTPFLSVTALFRERVGPLALMIEEWFPNDENIKSVKSSTVIIHGQKDRLIPMAHGEALYRSCPSRKLFINPQDMEHNTNLYSDSSYLIVPMFRFFALPDYSFEPMSIPPWAFNKRRSSLYVRPGVQVSSNTDQVHSDRAPSGTLLLPAGDDAIAPLDCAQERDPSLIIAEPGRVFASTLNKPPAADYESFAVLTQPTVLHSYSATKQRYKFQDPNNLSTQGP